MSGKFRIRTVAALTCLAAACTGWDAEAARWSSRRSSCCVPVCCEPVYYETVCCEPACVSYVPSCSRCCTVDTGYRVIQETVVRTSCDCVAGAPEKKQEAGSVVQVTEKGGSVVTATQARTTSLHR